MGGSVQQKRNLSIHEYQSVQLLNSVSHDIPLQTVARLETWSVDHSTCDLPVWNVF